MADQTPRNAEWQAWSVRQREQILKRPLEHRLQIVRMQGFANLTEEDQKAVWVSIRMPQPAAGAGPSDVPKGGAQLQPRVRTRRPLTFEPASKYVAPYQFWAEGEQAFALGTAVMRWAIILFGGLALLWMLVEHSW